MFMVDSLILNRMIIMSSSPFMGVYRKIFRRQRKMIKTEPLMYRVDLYNQLLAMTGKQEFRDNRILEVGPKDGCDSKRLASLSPKEFVMIDLPNKREGNEKWLGQITGCKTTYLETNFMYMSPEEYQQLGSFYLIWCTGVIYHNPEQMRFLRKLYKLLDVNGYLVLESAVLRVPASLKDGKFVQICYPEPYKQNGNMTHLPTANAVKAWLGMVGFKEIHDSDCHAKYSKFAGKRYAWICRKGDRDEGHCYFRSPYRYGDST
jgi:hypothetical protein